MTLAILPVLLLGVMAAPLQRPAMNAPSLVKLEPVPFTQVQIRDRFWSNRQETNRKATVEHSLRMLDRAGNFLVMQLAAEGKREGYKGLLFTDSDLYKVLEGVAYTLDTHPDRKLDQRMDEIIAMIAAAQQADGYLNTWIQVTKPEQRFKNLRDWHELYCAGHLFEAAAAHFQATGKRTLLDVALRFADLINQKYGPEGEAAYCGHPEIELALVKLWKVTGDRKWFELARRMVERRGSAFFAREHGTPTEKYDGTYWQDDVPIRDHREIKGHAVRAAYLLSGAADVARETGDEGLLAMLERVWRNATEKRVFITGGIGPSGHNEGFTVDYDLPNLTAYQETCASIAMALWGHRMGLLFADGRYFDAVEKALYNGLLSGVALDGRSFFYVNPLASMGNHHRRDWYDCACCPPNVLRTIASIGGYGFATSEDGLYVGLYLGGAVRAEVGGKEVELDVETDYPWDGKVKLTFKKAAPVTLNLRVPGWCERASFKVNGKSVEPSIANGFAAIEQNWKPGDAISVDLPMPVRQWGAHPHVKADAGLAAVQRGPLVYCLEQADHTMPIQDFVIPRGAKFDARWEKGVLGGIVVVETAAEVHQEPDWERALYRPLANGTPVKARLIPYGFWDNRKAGRMEVWIPTVPPVKIPRGPESRAVVEVSFKNDNAQPSGVNDGIEPKSSGEQPAALCHFWPHKGGEEWVQYTWQRPQTVYGIQLYWFDDTGRGECRLPKSWRLLALDGGNWVEVPISKPRVSLDEWCETRFAPVTTTALRLVVQQRDGWSSGIHEWRVLDDEGQPLR
jgi:DUF1680 family protein